MDFSIGGAEAKGVRERSLHKQLGAIFVFPAMLWLYGLPL
jgi:hypothetical protein